MVPWHTVVRPTSGHCPTLLHQGSFLNNSKLLERLGEVCAYVATRSYVYVAMRSSVASGNVQQMTWFPVGLPKWACNDIFMWPTEVCWVCKSLVQRPTRSTDIHSSKRCGEHAFPYVKVQDASAVQWTYVDSPVVCDWRGYRGRFSS